MWVCVWYQHQHNIKPSKSDVCFFVVDAVAVVVVIAYCNRPYLYRLSTQTNTSKIIQSAALTWECNSYLLSSFFALSLSQYTHLVAFFRLIFCVYWIFFSCVILYISKTDFKADFTVHISICCHRSFSRALCDGYIDFFGGCLLKCSSICLHTFVDCIFEFVYDFAFDEGKEKKTCRQTIDESKINKWQLSISRINLMKFDTMGFILSFIWN